MLTSDETVFTRYYKRINPKTWGEISRFKIDYFPQIPRIFTDDDG